MPAVTPGCEDRAKGKEAEKYEASTTGHQRCFDVRESAIGRRFRKPQRSRASNSDREEVAGDEHRKPCSYATRMPAHSLRPPLTEGRPPLQRWMRKHLRLGE